jgi:hypothetical protein
MATRDLVRAAVDAAVVGVDEAGRLDDELGASWRAQLAGVATPEDPTLLLSRELPDGPLSLAPLRRDLDRLRAAGGQLAVVIDDLDAVEIDHGDAEVIAAALDATGVSLLASVAELGHLPGVLARSLLEITLLPLEHFDVVQMLRGRSTSHPSVRLSLEDMRIVAVAADGEPRTAVALARAVQDSESADASDLFHVDRDVMRRAHVWLSSNAVGDPERSRWNDTGDLLDRVDRLDNREQISGRVLARLGDLTVAEIGRLISLQRRLGGKEPDDRLPGIGVKMVELLEATGLAQEREGRIELCERDSFARAYMGLATEDHEMIGVGYSFAQIANIDVVETIAAEVLGPGAGDGSGDASALRRSPEIASYREFLASPEELEEGDHLDEVHELIVEGNAEAILEAARFMPTGVDDLDSGQLAALTVAIEVTVGEGGPTMERVVQCELRRTQLTVDECQARVGAWLAENCSWLAEHQVHIEQVAVRGLPTECQRLISAAIVPDGDFEWARRLLDMGEIDDATALHRQLLALSDYVLHNYSWLEGARGLTASRLGFFCCVGGACGRSARRNRDGAITLDRSGTGPVAAAALQRCVRALVEARMG